MELADKHTFLHEAALGLLNGAIIQDEVVVLPRTSAPDDTGGDAELGGYDLGSIESEVVDTDVLAWVIAKEDG